VTTKRIPLALLLGGLAISGDAQYVTGQALTAAELNASLSSLTTAGIINVKNSTYGANGNGTTDDTRAIQAAAATGLPLYFPPGTYKTSATIAFTNSVYGHKADGTLISCTNLTVPVATLVGTNVEVKNITFTHSSAPTAGSGANGLNILAGSYQTNISSSVANYDDYGFAIFTGSSALWLSKNNASNNSTSGFLLQDPNYFLDGNISTANASHGYEIRTVSFGAGLQMVNNLSYNNGGDGYSAIGTSGATLNDVYMANNISSYDRGNGFYFDTHGINFLLDNNYSEYSGYTTGGSIYSNGAVAYSFTANNDNVSLSGDEGYHAASNGVFNGGSNVTINGGIYRLNGQGSRGGYGISGTNAGFTNLTGSDLRGNMKGAQNTIAGYASFYNALGLNQATFLTPPPLPGSGSGVLNPFNIPVTVILTGMTFTSIKIRVAGTTSPALSASQGASFSLAPGQTIVTSYTGSPTWVWLPN